MIATSLPKRILSAPEGALSSQVDAQWVRVFPSNLSQVQGPIISAQTSSGETLYLNNIQFPATAIRFQIPCGAKGAYIDTQKSRVNWRVNYACTTALTNATATTSVAGQALGWFDRLTHYNANGNIIDDETGKAQIELHKSIFGCNSAERDSLSQVYGFRSEKPLATATAASANSSYVGGHAISTLSGATPAIGNGYYSYSVPLPSSLLGSQAKNMCPIGKVAKLDVELTTSALAPVIMQVANSGAGAGVGAVQFTIDQISIDLYYVYLDAKSEAMLPQGPSYVHGLTYRASNGTIPSNTAGQVSTLLGIRGQSVRALATRVSETTLTTAGSVNNVLDSKMPLVSQMDYFLGGKVRFPPQPHNTVIQPSAVFNSALQASEAFTQKEFRFAGVPYHFNRYAVHSTVPAASAGYDQWLIDAGSTTVANDLACFAFAEDLRRTSTSTIMDGFNLSTAANNYLELNLASANSYTWNLTFIACMDIVYIIDAQGNVESRF